MLHLINLLKEESEIRSVVTIRRKSNKYVKIFIDHSDFWQSSIESLDTDLQLFLDFSKFIMNFWNITKILLVFHSDS